MSLESYISNTTSFWEGADGESELRLSIQDGILKGEYTTSKGRIEADTKTIEICGYQNGELVSFSGSWGKAHSVTAWVGRLNQESDDRVSLNLQWLLAREFGDLETKKRKKLWESFLSYHNKLYYVSQGGNDE